MLLNLCIIKDYLKGHPVLQEKVDRMTVRSLQHLQMYKKGASFQDNYIYLCFPEDLPTEIDGDKPLSLLCIGFIPSLFASRNHTEYLCFSSSEDPHGLFLDVMDLFNYFEDYDRKIKDMIIEHQPLRKFGDLAKEFFGEPASAFGSFEKILFISYDESDKKTRQLYDTYTTEYFPDDEKSILYQDTEFRHTFEAREPSFSTSPMYKQQIIFYNLFINDVYVGRFMIENVYRPFRDSDYRLVEWFGEYVKILINNARAFHFPASREFEHMIEEFMLPNAVFRKEFVHVLNEIDWKMNDTYMCNCIAVAESENTEKILNDAAFYLQELLDDQYIFIQHHRLYQIINVTKSQYAEYEINRRLNIYLQNNALFAGSGSRYDHFDETPLHLRQAHLLADYALRDKRKKIYQFDQSILDLLLTRACGNNETAVFYTRHLKRLYDYDTANSSSLISTLRCYLENDKNISQTSEKLFIARTTCLYRIRRIREVSHINFDNPEEILYLRIMLRMDPTLTN